MNGLVEGVAGNALWGGIRASVERVMGRQIRITHPRPTETLTDPERCLGEGLCFPVRGTLKSLPAQHEIWLLLEEQTGQVRPQGFFPVQNDPQQRSWIGKIHATGRTHVKIIAVVAPPTSQDFFRYYQRLGSMTKFEPLNRVPPECLNATFVQARVI
jgi:hypothetical protein